MNIGFVGAGKVGKALGLYFKNHGLTISGYYSKTAASAQDAAALTDSRPFTALNALAGASDALFIAVPDQAIEDIDRLAAALVSEKSVKPEIIWIHVSGAHPSNHLAALKREGCAVGSMHPLCSFGEPAASAAKLSQVWFTVEGTDKAVWAMEAILTQTGGRYSLIKDESKAVYHAGACIVSNFLLTLLESGIRCFESAGMDRDDVVQAIMPLIDATLSNIRDKGTIDALTGPIVRGDTNTVDVHLAALKARLPSELDFYKVMALKTAQMLDGNRLTHEQAVQFKQLLEG